MIDRLFTRNNILLSFGLLAAVVLMAGLFVSQNAENNIVSPELGISELSPSGERGGRIVPASCSSYEHYPGECSPPSFSARNSENDPTTDITIAEGKTITLDWECQSSVSSSSSNFDSDGEPSGSVTLSPTADTTYTLVCSNGGSGAVSVDVINPALTVTATPNRVRSGSASTITWEVIGANSCTLTGPNVSTTGTSGSAATGALTSQSTYNLVCQTDGGVVSTTAVVTIAPAFEEI